MHQEIEPTKKPLSPEAIVSPSKENLASQMSRVLEKAQATGETYSLSGAAEFLNQLVKEKGIETNVSRTTFQKWTTITLAKIIKPIANLPQEELSSEIFKEKFPNEKALPLSPTALVSFKGHHRYNGTLSIHDLRGVIACAQQAYEGGLMAEYRPAKVVIRSFRRGCFSLHEMARILKYRYPDSSFLHQLDRLILNGTLPLKNYPRILARAIGIPNEFFSQELKEEWLKIFESKKKEQYSPRTLLAHYPEEFSSFSRFLRTVHGIKFLNRYLPLLTIYFQEKGIGIMTEGYEPTGGTYHILSLKVQKEIKKLLENEEAQEEISRITSKGFTLEEYTQTYCHRFPDGTPIALTEAIRLAGGPKIFTNKRRFESIKGLLRKRDIPLKEKLLTSGKRKTICVYLPIEKLAEAVDILKREGKESLGFNQAAGVVQNCFDFIS